MAKQKKSDFFQRVSIRNTIFIYFTVSALVMLLLVGVSIYGAAGRAAFGCGTKRKPDSDQSGKPFHGYVSSHRYETVGFAVLWDH